MTGERFGTDGMLVRIRHAGHDLAGLPALQIALQITEAHEAGVVDRALKPANVKITPEGQVKVLDFGLAKAMDPRSGVDATARDSMYLNSPTLSVPATNAGVILGTAIVLNWFEELKARVPNTRQ